MDGMRRGMSDDERARVVALLEESRDDLLRSVASLTDAQWHHRPRPDRWSIAEVVEHLALVEPALFGQVEGALSDPEHPDAASVTAGKDDVLERFLADRSESRPAPERVQPAGNVVPADARARFEAARDTSLAFARTSGAPVHVHTRDHRRPAYGTLSAYQWLLFIGYHTRRHHQQVAEVMTSDGYPA